MSLRVSGSVIVVPPFECAWLTGPEYTLRGGRGCLSFEAKGETDVTVILKAAPGSKRLQPLQRRSIDLDPSNAAETTVEPNYTIIWGSHRNSCLKIEKNGETVAMVTNMRGVRVDSKQFVRLWLQYEAGVITVGTDEPSPDTATFRWEDVDAAGPIADIQHAGLSCWDRHVSFRSIKAYALVTALPTPSSYLPLVVPSLLSPRTSAPGPCIQEESMPTVVEEPGSSWVSLFQRCTNELIASVSPLTVCVQLQVADMLLPNTMALYRFHLDFLAAHFLEVVGSCSPGLCLLSPSVLADLLHCNSIPVSEKAIFDAVEQWAAAVSAHLFDSCSSTSRVAASTRNMDGSTNNKNIDGSTSNRNMDGSTSVMDGSTNNRGGSTSNNSVDVRTSNINRDGSTSNMDGSTRNMGHSGGSHLAAAQTLPAAGTAPASETAPLGSQLAAAQTIPASHTAPSCSGQETAQTRPVFQANPAAQTLPSDRTAACVDASTASDSRAGVQQPAVATESSGGRGSSSIPVQPGSSCIAVQPGSSSIPVQPGSSSIAVQPGSSSIPVQPGSSNRGHHGVDDAEQEENENATDSDVAWLLSLIRYPLMRPEELNMVMKRPLVQKHQAALALVEEALSLCTACGFESGGCSSSSSGGGMNSLAKTVSLFSVENKRMLKSPLDAGMFERFQRRCLPASQELTYVSDGDKNGVFHYIGTLYGSQEWVNPVLSKRVEVKASSPVSRQTDPKALVGDKFLRINYAGPRYVDGAPVTWWAVDLGCHHTLMVNYYTIRQDGSSDFMRHWVLQASDDGQQWADIQRHRKDTTIKRAGQYASWPVIGPAASVPYRYFRLLLEGPTTSSTSPNNLCLTYFELYGHLYLPKGQ